MLQSKLFTAVQKDTCSRQASHHGVLLSKMSRISCSGKDFFRTFPLINDLSEMFEECWADDSSRITQIALNCPQPDLAESDEEDGFDFWAHNATLGVDCKESAYADLVLHPNTEVFSMASDDNCCSTEPLHEGVLASNLSRISRCGKDFLRTFPLIDDLCEVFEEQWADSATIATTASINSMVSLDDCIFEISSDCEEEVWSDTAFDALEACNQTTGAGLIHHNTEVFSMSSDDNCLSLQQA